MPAPPALSLSACSLSAREGRFISTFSHAPLAHDKRFSAPTPISLAQFGLLLPISLWHSFNASSERVSVSYGTIVALSIASAMALLLSAFCSSVSLGSLYAAETRLNAAVSSSISFVILLVSRRASSNTPAQSS